MMNELYDIKVGRRVRHVDGDGRAGIVKRFYAYPLVTVEWESTGRESTENMAYLLPVFHRITVYEVTTGRGHALRIVAHVDNDFQGERVVIEKWLTPARAPDGSPEHPLGTLTYRRICGPDDSVEELEPERVVAEGELYPDVAALL
ncbi:hypothetical protein [Streptomyces sp. NPDC057253]|uniref:hypothetical protein n=1 Tax=Streptomyces sp. NPDC057253 TaxID=3346069 RepID=UPI003634ABF9